MYGSSLGVYFVVIPEEFVEMFLEITVFPLAVVVVGEAVMSSPISSSPPPLLPSSLTVKICTVSWLVSEFPSYSCF